VKSHKSNAQETFRKERNRGTLTHNSKQQLKKITSRNISDEQPERKQKRGKINYSLKECTYCQTKRALQPSRVSCRLLLKLDAG